MILTYETNTKQGEMFNIKAWNAESSMKSATWSHNSVFRNALTERAVDSKFFEGEFFTALNNNVYGYHKYICRHKFSNLGVEK